MPFGFPNCSEYCVYSLYSLVENESRKICFNTLLLASYHNNKTVFFPLLFCKVPQTLPFRGSLCSVCAPCLTYSILSFHYTWNHSLRCFPSSCRVCNSLLTSRNCKNLYTGHRKISRMGLATVVNQYSSFSLHVYIPF